MQEIEKRTNDSIWWDWCQTATEDVLGDNFRGVADYAFEEFGTFGLGLFWNESVVWPLSCCHFEGSRV